MFYGNIYEAVEVLLLYRAKELVIPDLPIFKMSNKYR